MSDCTLNARESPQILSTFEDILVTSYRHKYKLKGSSVRHTDAIVGLCNQREGSKRFLKLARTRFDLVKIENYHPKYSNFCKRKERYAVYHMTLKREALIGAVCGNNNNDGIDVDKFATFYESIKGGYSLITSNRPTNSSTTTPSSPLEPSHPPIASMKHMFPKVTYAVWLEFLDSNNIVNKTVAKLNPRYWEGFNPHITLSVGFKNKAGAGDGDDSDDAGSFSNLECENVLYKILEKYHQTNKREPEVTVRTSKNEQGNGGKFLNVFKYDAYKATIPFLLIESSDSLEKLNECCNDVVEGERDRNEFQPHVALAYYDSGEVGVEGFEELRKELEEEGVEALKGNRLAISFNEITGEGTSEWRCICRREIGVGSKFEGPFKLFAAAPFECEIRVSEGKGLGGERGISGNVLVLFKTLQPNCSNNTPALSCAVFAKTRIPEGAFLGVYVGGAKDEDDDETGNYGDFGNGQYLFCVPGTKRFIDAGDKEKSNWTRYINHATPKEGCNVKVEQKTLVGGCGRRGAQWNDPEEIILEGGEFWSIDKGDGAWGGHLGWIDMGGDNMDRRKRIEFYSAKAIEIGDELTFDYGGGGDLGHHPFKFSD